MSTTQEPYSIFRNPAAVTLAVVGALAVILGPILWVWGSNQLKHDQNVADYTHAIGLDNGVNIDVSNDPSQAADQMLIGWGIGILILGVVLLVAFLVVAAVKRPEVVAAPVKTYDELQQERKPSAGTYFE